VDIPTSLKSVWVNGLVQRLQQVVSGNKGYSIVRFSVLVDKDGDPVFWSAPTCTNVEPKGRGSDFLAEIISSL